MREKATEKAINRSECKRNSKVVLGEAGAEVEEHKERQWRPIAGPTNCGKTN